MSTPTASSQAASRFAIVVQGVVQGVGLPAVRLQDRPPPGIGRLGPQPGRRGADRDRRGGAGAGGLCRSAADRRPAASRGSTTSSSPGWPPARDLPIRSRLSPAAATRPLPTIPADLATCAECQAEIRSPEQRRHGYPFTNCTNCGPRWSIITALPYDRQRTAMAGFAMCPACQAEYGDPADRRFHAQPIACPHCGPHLELLAGGTGVPPVLSSQKLASHEAALAGAVESLRGGRIVALQGLGGFQLLVEATSEAAVRRLRDRKHRPDKPLAVMLRTLDEVRR